MIYTIGICDDERSICSELEKNICDFFLDFPISTDFLFCTCYNIFIKLQNGGMIMTKEELLKKTFSSAYEAMYALNRFLDDIDKSSINETRSNYQNLRVVGNRIFEV